MDRAESAPHLMDPPSGRMCKDESHRSRLAGVVRSFFPRPYIRHLLSGEPLPRGKGAFLFVDVSGFTAISEEVLQYGTLGTEILTHSLNRMFSEWIEQVERYGGEVYRFAGDAIYALFPGEHNLRRAVQAVKHIMAWSEQEAGLTLPDGREVQLSLHAGLSKGTYTWVDLGSQDWVVGAGWARAIRAAAHADPFTLVADQRTVAALPDTWVEQTRMRTYCRVCWRAVSGPMLSHPSSSPEPLPDLVEVPESLLTLLPGVLRQHFVDDPSFQVLHGEHRWIAMVFLHLRLPHPRHAVSWLRDRLTEIQALVHRTGGWVSRVEPAASGVRLVVLFGYPRMQDFPSREAARFMHYLRETLPPGSYRGSLHGGTVFAGLVGSDRRRELTVMGDPVNTAARIASRAPWGTLWASREIQHRVQVSYTPVEPRTLRLKGKQTPQQVAVLRPRHERWNPGTFVGREDEYRTFLHHIRETPRWVVGISGAAGMGKSHFLQQLSGDLERMGFTVLVGYGVRDPLWTYTPFRVMLRRFLGTGPDVISRLDHYGLEGEQVGLVAEVLGIPIPSGRHPVLPPEMIPEARRRALRTLLYGIAQQHGSLVLWMDDVHWMDAESRALLEDVWRHAPEGLALGVGCAFRPREDVHTWLKNWPGYREIRLSRLDARAVQQMARILLGGFLDARSVSWILSRSDGNPLVIHEWLRVLHDRDELVQAGRYWKLRQTPETSVSPDSVHTLVHQRVDALPPALRRVVLHASVLGMVFSPEFLAHLLQTRVEHLPLRELQKRGFMEALPEGAYRFVHTLIRDAVYHALSHRQRRQLHARAVQYLLNQAEHAPELL
ncbi:MAG: AAA family ATPase, partial [Candidatus Hydrothermae bacterium]|nr:AAA family ATPase [Candidatus Hydrothermae bacterium]